MDPDKCLADIRYLVEQLPADDGAASALAERVQALDEWISRGGFLPDAWLVDNEGNPL